MPPKWLETFQGLFGNFRQRQIEQVLRPDILAAQADATMVTPRTGVTSPEPAPSFPQPGTIGPTPTNYARDIGRAVGNFVGGGRNWDNHPVGAVIRGLDFAAENLSVGDLNPAAGVAGAVRVTGLADNWAGIVDDVMSHRQLALQSRPERLARARTMGYDIENPLYTGFKRPVEQTYSDIESVYPNSFFTRDPEVAQYYARNMGMDTYAGQVLPVYARQGNVLDIERLVLNSSPENRFQVREFARNVYENRTPGHAPTSLNAQEIEELIYNRDWWTYSGLERNILGTARGQGYDAIRLPDNTDGLLHDAFVTLNPSIVRSPNAAFDPRRMGESDLLAGLAGAMLLRQQAQGAGAQ